jgi:hypothetical protein
MNDKTKESEVGHGAFGSTESTTSTTAQIGATNEDIVAMFSKMNLTIVDTSIHLDKLDNVEKKLEKFDFELKKIWLHINDTAKVTQERVDQVDDWISSAEKDLENAIAKMNDIEGEKYSIKSELNCIKAQSMRNNLIIGNLEETVNETPAQTKKIVKDFLINKLQIAEETALNLKLDRVHRMGVIATERGGEGIDGRGNAKKYRRIVCKFTFYKDKEMDKLLSNKLRNTKYYITEQYPPEVAANRRKLVPKISRTQSVDST